MFVQRVAQGKNNSWKQCSRSGFAWIWLSWIRIRFRNADPDPGARKFTKFNKGAWIPAFQRGSCTFIGRFVDPLNFSTDPDPRFHTFDKNILFFPSFFACYFLKVHLHHFSKIKSHKEVTKPTDSRFFLQFLLEDRRIRIRIRTFDLRIREARSHTDSTVRINNTVRRYVFDLLPYLRVPTIPV